MTARKRRRKPKPPNPLQIQAISRVPESLAPEVKKQVIAEIMTNKKPQKSGLIHD